MTFINEVMPLWFFAVVFTPIIAILLVLIGNVFRKKQMQTDLDLSYMEASESAKSLRILYDMILDSGNPNKRDEANQRREFLKKIEEKNMPKS